MTPSRLLMIQGDITKIQVEAIVNAANERLLGGGGVDGAIHRAAGPELLAACRKLGGCPTGEARITPGYKLPAKWVIHTVGPIYQGGGQGEAALLRSAYQACLKLAVEKGITELAFPSISTGVYGYPLPQAAPLALHSLVQGLEQFPQIRRIQMVCFDLPTLLAYQGAWSALQGSFPSL